MNMLGLLDGIQAGSVKIPRRYIWGGSVLLVVVLILCSRPIFMVDASEEGLVLTFGRYSYSVGPGMHFKAPWPFQTTRRVEVTKVRRLEIGFRTISSGPPPQYRDFRNDPKMAKEAQMLTGDENIISVDMTVLYRVADARRFAFLVKEPERALRHVAEGAVRQVVGDRSIGTVLTTGKGGVQGEIREMLQTLVDLYGVGVTIQQVQLGEVQPPAAVAAAFKDVATAKEDKERLVNEAKGYQNEQIPQARGQAVQIIKVAEAYAAQRVARAEGEAKRFAAIAAEYTKAPEVTMKRMYLETMGKALTGTRKVVVDEETAVLNLNRLSELIKGGQ